MSRKKLIRSQTLPYHVTARTNNREHFPIALDRTWKILAHHCFEAQVLYDARIHALVLMPNHFHLILSTPREDLGKVTETLMRSITKSINRVSGRSGHVFGGPYHWTLIDSAAYFAHALKYIYRNPVKAGLCERVESFRFSTLHGLLGESPLPFPLHYPYGGSNFILIPIETESLLRWLNRPFRNEHETAIQRALRRREFKPPRQRWRKGLEELKSALI